MCRFACSKRVFSFSTSALHSAMETASCKDAEYMAKAVAAYYNTPIFQPKDGEWKLGL